MMTDAQVHKVRFEPVGIEMEVEEGETVLKQTFGPNYERLREIQAKYDPDGLFRFNLRIPPKA